MNILRILVFTDLLYCGLNQIQLTPDKWNLQETEEYGST